MKAGIKFCGGCNPTYDRGEMVKKLKSELAGQLTFEAADIHSIYDVILVVGGCKKCCADYTRLRSKSGWLFIVSDRDYSRVYNSLKQLVTQVADAGGVQ